MDIELFRKKIEDKSLVVCVFGVGRIGLPTAMMYARGGYHTIGVDINEKLIEDLKQMKTFVDEPGLPEILQTVIDNKTIEFTTQGADAIKRADVIIYCVPTPVNEDKIPIFTAIEAVSKLTGANFAKNKIVINESSVSPTTIKTLIIPLLEKESGLKLNDDFGVCSCPERADPGKIIDNWDKIPRIVGGSSDGVGKLIVQLYQAISKAEIHQVSTPGTANAVKLTENIFRDVNIALINEFAILYEKLGIDVKEVIKGASTKYNFQPHYPGPGVGGPCLPANSFYIIKDAVKVDYIPFLIRVSREINDRMPEYILELIIKALNHLGKSLKNSTITILGISYKANVRDIQISPSMKVVEYLQANHATLKVFDPYYAGEQVENFTVTKNMDEAFEGSDAVVLLTDHNEFFFVNFDDILKKRDSPLILVDSRNIYDTAKLPKGLIYCGAGRALKEL